jgi:hypothetical protein
MQQDLQATISTRQGLEGKVQSTTSRADKAEAELCALQQSNVDLNLQKLKLQAELAQLRESHQCAPATFARMPVHICTPQNCALDF